MDDNEYFRVVVLDGDEDVPAEVSDNNEDFKFEMSEEGYPEIKLQSGEELRVVEKIRKEDFTSYHHEVISDMNFSNGNLIFKDPDWESFLLGSGEEKAVFRVCDHNNKVFAIEVIDERHYLNGRFVNGEYFFSKRISSISGMRLNSDSLIGLAFTGLIKVREFVNGYECGRFQFNYYKRGFLDRILTDWLHLLFSEQFDTLKKHYKDVHERNVMFEILVGGEDGRTVFYKDIEGKTKLVKVVLRAIDVR